MGRKRNKEHSGKRVKDLLPGEGKGAVIIRNVNNKIRVKGKVISGPDGEQNLIALKGNPEKRLSFGPGTRLRRWRTRARLRGK